MSNQERPPQAGQPVQIQIEMDEQTAQGIYINLAMMAHTETEFTFDFIYLQPQQPKARVRARIISSPSHTKQLLLALQENIQKYEKAFGPIKVATVPEKKIGFSK
ncbi:MAG: DUF3467 domain-containing protein [Nitrospirae bacterium]|nr:DUF3467 domain-containing protein [Nitrospirota bacterium]